MTISYVILLLQPIERFGELGQNHRLPAVRPGGNHSDARAALALLEPKILPRGLRQFIEFGNSLRRLAPAFERSVTGFDTLKLLHVGGNLVGDFAVDLVAHA